MVAHVSACSARKMRANRRNAKKSTGPKTADGKARSCRNATGYGIFCQSLVLPGESRKMFDMLRTSLIHEHQPQNVTELFLVDRMASAMWRLRRLQAAEADAHEIAEMDLIEKARKVRRKLERQMQEYADDEAEDAAQTADAQDDSLDEHDRLERRHERQARQRAGQRLHDYESLTDHGHIPASMTTNRLINDGRGKQSTLEKLSLYEKRLEGTVHRCLRDLRKLRTPAKGERVPDRRSPFLELEIEVPEPQEPEQESSAQVSEESSVARDDEKVKNEATEEAPAEDSPRSHGGTEALPAAKRESVEAKLEEMGGGSV